MHVSHSLSHSLSLSLSLPSLPPVPPSFSLVLQSVCATFETEYMRKLDLYTSVFMVAWAWTTVRWNSYFHMPESEVERRTELQTERIDHLRNEDLLLKN